MTLARVTRLREEESFVIMAEINSLQNLEPCRLTFGRHMSVAALAAVDRPQAVRTYRKLEMRLLTVLEACWAKPMRWLGATDRWLVHVSECPAPQIFQFIPLLPSFPIGKLANLCFERRYLIQLRQLRLLGFNKLADSITQEQP
jgi:hypothetical protein